MTTDNKVKDYTQDPVADWVVKRFFESKNYYAPIFEKMRTWDDQYFAIPKAKKYTWQSNVFVPATYKAIKTLLARIIAALFPTNPPFDTVGVEEKDKDGEIPQKRLVGYQFEKTNIYDKFVLMVLQALIRGTSVGKIFWTKQEQYIPVQREVEEDVQVFVDEQGKPLKKGKSRTIKQTKTKTVYESKIIYEGPDFEVIDILGGFFPDPYGQDYNIHRVIRTEDYLRKSKHYTNLDEALKTEYPGDEELWQHSRLENIGIGNPKFTASSESDSIEEESDSGLSKYELLEYHGKFDINGDGKLEESIITVCNRSVVISKRLSPYPEGCFVKIGFMPVLNEYFWQGVCELVENLQNELNDKRNQRLDNVNLVLQKILVYVEGAVDTQIIKNFVFAPGARLGVNDINGIKWESPDDVTASAYQEESIITSDIQETSGAVNVLMPTANQGDIHRTASGLFMLKGEAETSIKLIVQMIENMGLADIARKYSLLNKDLMTRPLATRILGTSSDYDYITITPEEIKYYNCDFIFRGASAYVNREIRLAQLTKMMDVISKLPMMQNQIDPEKLSKMIANTLGFDEKEILRDKINPILNQGFAPKLNTIGLGGQGTGNPALDQMVNMGLPLSQVQGQMEQMQQQAI